MTASAKDTIYIDIDDEITAIIEKVKASESKVVALVLPKRATALQSIVNMKLLKRAGKQEGKNLVLITSEAGLMPLAGVVGMHVAKNLQSAPAIPDIPDDLDADGIEEVVADNIPEDSSVDASKSVGELATKKTTSVPAAVEETIDLDEEEAAAEAKASPAKGGKSKKSKLKIPNFEKFRLKLFLGIGGFIVLILLWWLANSVLPKATITIKTDTSTTNANLTFTASVAAKTVDVGNQIVPAKKSQNKKTDTQEVPTTGTKDVGTKATGTVTMSIPCSTVKGSPPEIPAGTGVSAQGLNFITQTNVTLDNPDFSGGCKFTGSTAVAAQSNGDNYNLTAQSYTVSYVTSPYNKSDIAANGTDMTGGSSKTIKIVSSDDITTAKKKLGDLEKDAKTELIQDLKDAGYVPLTDTFNGSKVTVTSSPNVGAEGDTVSVTSAGTYTMLGAKQEDLEKLIRQNIKSQIDTSKQTIQNYGIDDAVFQSQSSKPGGDDLVSMQVAVTLGPNINEDQIKSQVAGKKRGETESIITGYTGVKEVKIDYSPFWVIKTPKPSKTTIIIEKAQ